MSKIKLAFCYLLFGCFHDYGKWSQDSFYTQQRVCSKCGKSQVREKI